MSEGVHASALLVGERGLLLRGVSGSGKSLLALALVERVRRGGGFAALVADDRVWLEAQGGRLIARGAAATAGMCERRGFGLVAVPQEREAVVRLVVDLAPRGESPPRMPQGDGLYVNLCGVRLPRLALDMAPGLDGAASAALSGLEGISDGVWRKNVSPDVIFA
jgi:serine kinase of HPr protein (carbohydrate metabolism regulator)